MDFLARAVVKFLGSKIWTQKWSKIKDKLAAIFAHASGVANHWKSAQLSKPSDIWLDLLISPGQRPAACSDPVSKVLYTPSFFSPRTPGHLKYPRRSRVGLVRKPLGGPGCSHTRFFVRKPLWMHTGSLFHVRTLKRTKQQSQEKAKPGCRHRIF